MILTGDWQQHAALLLVVVAALVLAVVGCRALLWALTEWFPWWPKGGGR